LNAAARVAVPELPILWPAIDGVPTSAARTAVFVRRRRERSGLLWFAAVLRVLVPAFALARVV
jgi:hypothetical protein